MWNRRDWITGSVRTFALAGLVGRAVRGADEPWTDGELLKPEELAKRIEAGSAPPIICVAFPVLFGQRHIRGAKFAGPGNKAEGLKDLETFAATLSKDSEVVIYCGCCPMKNCPNIRPAYSALKRLGFKKVRVLDIPNNMHNDWTTKGYPSEPPQAPRS